MVSPRFSYSQSSQCYDAGKFMLVVADMVAPLAALPAPRNLAELDEEGILGKDGKQVRFRRGRAGGAALADRPGEHPEWYDTRSLLRLQPGAAAAAAATGAGTSGEAAASSSAVAGEHARAALAGIALEQVLNGEHLLECFLEQDLPTVPADRFRALFRRKESWTVEELKPYIE